MTAGQDIHSEVEHLEERGEDGKDGVEHRAHPPLDGGDRGGGEEGVGGGVMGSHNYSMCQQIQTAGNKISVLTI